jgi:hypothetical protein
MTGLPFPSFQSGSLPRSFSTPLSASSLLLSTPSAVPLHNTGDQIQFELHLVANAAKRFLTDLLKDLSHVSRFRFYDIPSSFCYLPAFPLFFCAIL